MFLNTRYENIKESMEEGYLSVATHLRYFAAKLAERGGGHIAVVGSYQGVTIGLPVYSLESANGHAIWALCESVRDELRSYGVVLSYFVGLNFDLEAEGSDPQQAEVKKKKGYLTKHFERLFPECSIAAQADTLLDGIANQYFSNRKRKKHRMDVICDSYRVEFWRTKGIRERTRAYEFFVYPIKLMYRWYLLHKVYCLVGFLARGNRAGT